MSGGIDRSTSRRTASPNRRRRSSSSMAISRSSASSSSIARSALRVTRNRWCSRTSMPLKSRSRLASITWSMSTNREGSTSSSRGRIWGTLTRANPRSPLDGSRSPTAMDRRQGRDVRERVARVDRERRQDREDLVDEPLAQGVVVLRDRGVVDHLDALDRQLPPDVDVDRRAARRRGRATRSRAASSCSCGVRPSGEWAALPTCACWRSPAIRTWKNSSRLPAKMARNLTRSSSGLRSSRASKSTRALNSSHDSSRLRYGRWRRVRGVRRGRTAIDGRGRAPGSTAAIRWAGSWWYGQGRTRPSAGEDSTSR